MVKIINTGFLLIAFLINTSFFIPADYYYAGREVKLKITLKVDVSGHMNKIRLKMIIPADIKERQTINSLNFSIEPDSIYSANSNTYALFKLEDVEKDFKIIIKGNLTIYNIINTKADSATADLSKYLIAEPNIEVASDKIIMAAQKLKQANDIETAIKTFEYVKEHITYKRNAAIGAEKVLETGIGKCMDYSDLFVALLRANGIAAKSMFGIVVAEDALNPLHAWPEVYLKKQGWIRFDPTSGHSDIERDGKNYKMRISNKYVTLSEGRNDPELRTSIYSCAYKCTAGSTLKIQSSFDIAGQ